MIELARHIERLLLNNDCVMVPGLGGFVTSYVPARYVEAEKLFLPPIRTVGFNQQLIYNDGLLVQSYMQTYELSYPDALRMIDEAVSEVKACIHRDGVYELSGIGSLKSGGFTTYEFEPLPAGVISPMLYGLYSLSVPMIQRLQTVEEKTETSVKKKVKKAQKKSRKVYTFMLNREFVNYVAAAVVAVFFYFLWSAPVLVGETEHSQQAAFGLPVAETIVKSMETEAEVLPVMAEPEPIEAKYTVVLASSIPQKNANLFVSQLHEQGLTQASVLVKGRMVRVVHGTYATESQAYSAMKAIHAKGDTFAQAWVMAL